MLPLKSNHVIHTQMPMRTVFVTTTSMSTTNNPYTKNIHNITNHSVISHRQGSECWETFVGQVNFELNMNSNTNYRASFLNISIGISETDDYRFDINDFDCPVDRLHKSTRSEIL